LLVVAVIALVGCSADGIHSPQKFFPSGTLTSWDSCDKNTQAGNAIMLCASTGLIAGASAPSYNIEFALPSPSHVRIAVFDERAALVKVIFDQDEPATLDGSFRLPPISWDFTDAAGRHVPAGTYRLYFQAEQFLSTSDVVVD
jgi:hypothetical protein